MNLLWWARYLFVPHHSNNHRAKILHPSTLSVVVAIFLTGQFLLNFYLLAAPSVLGFASNITPERVIELTNQKRGQQGLPPLILSSKLNEAAQRKAGDMFAFNYWAHSSPSGRNPWVFFQEVGYKYLYAGENLARDFVDAESVVEAWMNSPSHRDNILNPNYKEIGLAVVDGTLGGVRTTLVVQLLGAPMSTSLLKKSATPVSVSTPKLGESSAIEERTPLISVLARARGEIMTPSLVSPFGLTKTMAIFLLGIILGALILDTILVWRKRIIRLSGRNIGHLIFTSILLLATILTTPGAIL